MKLLTAQPIDYLIIAAYFVVVLSIGAYVSRRTKSSKDFFESGRSLPAWIAGLALMSANLGAFELLGFSGQAAEYGIMAGHFYWIGAIPGMLFLGVVMMPFYYNSKIRSVPEYLQKRYNEPTRAVNALTFAVSTLIFSGVSMYSMGLIFYDLLGWNINVTIWLAAGIVLAYTLLGGLTSSIYNEVLQFFLILIGLSPLVYIGLHAVGGAHALLAQLPPPDRHVWAGTSHAAGNPMHITWPVLVMGLGVILGPGYWCTDFLIIQRALAAKDVNAAQRAPLIAAFPKALFPLLTVLPGLIALAVIPHLGEKGNIALGYNNALPLLMGRFYGPGLLGLGLTAMMASFMSGMAGNTTAFNTVFTYDLYQAYFVKDKDDKHYLNVGRAATVFGILASIGAAYLVSKAPSIMDFAQAVFGFVNAPLLGTFLLGMFWKKTTPWGAFFGLLLGTGAAAVHYVLSDHGVLSYATPQEGNFTRAIVAFAVGAAATLLISLFTAPRPVAELVGYVYSETPRPAPDAHLPWYERPVVLAAVVIVFVIVLNVLTW